MGSLKVAIVEDDKEICELERIALKNSGYEVATFSNGASFFEGLKTFTPDLAILDIMLPDTDGLEIIKRLRKSHAFPVIFVTAKQAEVDMLKGFDLGADDYIAKPFSVMEFVARVRAVLRRAENSSGKEIIEGGPFVIDLARRVVTVNGEEVTGLTFKEFELLLKLADSPERVFTREKLLNEVWGNDFLGESRTVDMHIKTLRQKLGSFGEHIKTVRNVGYKLIIEQSQKTTLL